MQISTESQAPLQQDITPYQAYQSECLALMGVTTWLPKHTDSQGVIYRPSSPWACQTSAVLEYSKNTLNDSPSGFQSAVAERALKKPALDVSGDSSATPISSVLNLKNELTSGPELIVEDLQPIEEKSVHVEVPRERVTGLPSRVAITGYALASDLFIVTDVPFAFSEPDALDRLALNLGKALLKHDILEWKSFAFSWPDQLKNPYFFARQDWQLGAFESFIKTLIGSDEASIRLVVAGIHAQKMIQESTGKLSFTSVQIAEVESLPQMLKIPELRKEAWQAMQAAFKR
ncbi:hypothetical protein [Marinomonas balearica]|uniref:Uncharacterized protein n=1 Tax=Marinomonas balearica TaxID=491947 RepID=A0A4R6M491_9GAMM|nr:hypothetical protein [Marinomonas balearica]TDO95515.1 hypothetical protein DFP79_3444 [Marinomonas balearica]